VAWVQDAGLRRGVELGRARVCWAGVGGDAGLPCSERGGTRVGLLGFAGREGKGAGLGCFWGLGWLGLGFTFSLFYSISYFKHHPI
jgi:hypothetical protein